MTQSTVIRNGVGAKVSREAEFRERSLKHYLEVQNARNAVHAYKKKVASTKGASKSKIVNLYFAYFLLKILPRMGLQG